MSLLFYMGESFMGHIYNPTDFPIDNTVYTPTAQDFAFVHLMAKFIETRRLQMEAFNRADVNEDGDVDVDDIQIVFNEMLGLNTGYTDRADVNRDGEIDISDSNQIQNVMLGNLNVNDPVQEFYDSYLNLINLE